MSFTYGFYNSVNHDRVYDAIQVSQIFDGLIADGVYKNFGSAFEILPSSGMSVTVGIGRAWFNHTWMYNDSLLPISLTSSDLTMSRIDAIIFEINRNTRTNTIKVIEGEPSASPSRPTPTSADDVYQYAIGYVTIRAGAESILSTDISMAVGTTETPYVVGIVNFNDDYVEVLQEQINQKEGKSVPTAYTILASGWNNGVYSFESDYPSSRYDITEILPNDSTTNLQRKLWEDASCNGYYTTNIIKATNVPKLNINVTLMVKEI